jgi:hypothetical protein
MTAASPVTRRTAIAFAASALGTFSAVAQPAQWPPVGPSDYLSRVAIGARAFDMRVFVNIPPAGVTRRPVLFVMHGVRRDADRYRDEWRGLSDKHGVVVLVPEFHATDFPKREAYNFGGVIDQKGMVRPNKNWHFQAIDQIDDFVGRSRSDARTFDLYGHSAGAQFAHRYALLDVSPRVNRIVIANAGSYSMPVLDKPFPWGLGGIGINESHISRILSLEGIVMLGDADTDPNHPALPRDAAAMAQGPHRFARGAAFFEALDAAARNHLLRLGWRKVVVPGVGHDNAAMAVAAARLLYGDAAR